MFIFKKIFFLILIILSSGCAFNNFEKSQNIINYSIELDTPNDKYNLYFKENLLSVEDSVNLLFFASIKILDNIGSEFFLSTIPCR